LLIALHARKSFASIARYRAAKPAGPLVVVLTGTDLYRDISTDADARASLDMATLLIVLQERGVDELSVRLRRKTRVVFQSAHVIGPATPPRRRFRVAVLGHLRQEKDPFRTAYAVQELPNLANLEIVHLGDALSRDMEDEARRLGRADRRYRWLGGLSHGRALDWLRRSHLLVVSSRMEGGANVICEAARIGVPVIASRIPGNVGMLGRGYPGMFPLEDTHSLARLIARAREDSAFYDRLRRSTTARGRLFTPAAERRGVLSVVREAVRLAHSA
jgi:putative glycosyltransferase (TIGR04348 family)